MPIQLSRRVALGGRLPLPVQRSSYLVLPSSHALAALGFPASVYSTGPSAPPPAGDWASRTRHQYGWPTSYGSQPPARPHEVRNRNPYQYQGPIWSHLSGLGDAQEAAIAQKVGAIAGTAVPAIPGVASSVAGIIGVTSAAAIPIIGAAIAGITIGIAMLLNSGCGQSCIITSNWANQAEALIQQNLNAYFALAKPRAQSAQAIALANFDAIWNKLASECGNPQLGGAGQRCISDRQAGSCHWKQTATYAPDIMAAGEPAIGQCWNWFSGYRDPIQNDPNTAPDAQSAQAGQLQTAVSSTAIPGAGGTVTTGTTSGTGISGFLQSKTFLLFAGVAVVAVMMSQSKGGNN